MRIGVDGREFKKGKMTGISRYLYSFLREVASTRSENKYIIFHNQHSEMPLESNNLKKVKIPEYFTLFWDQFQLANYLKREKVDVFLTPYFKAPLLCPAKLVVIINDLIPLVVPAYQNFRNLFKRIYFKEMLKKVAKKADRIITISQNSKKDIVEVLGVQEEKIEVVNLAADESFRPIKSDFKNILSKYGINKKFIFYFGNLSPHKNITTLINAYSRLSAEIKKEYRLVIGGRKGRYFQSLLEIIRALKIEGQVIFTGFIPEEDLPHFYNAASVFVFPSLYEGFGLPPLEAMACGTPVIASKAASLPEVIAEGGILIDPHNSKELSEKIYPVLTNEEMRKNLSIKALNRAKNFSWEKFSKEVLKVLEETFEA